MPISTLSPDHPLEKFVAEHSQLPEVIAYRDAYDRAIAAENALDGGYNPLIHSPFEAPVDAFQQAVHDLGQSVIDLFDCTSRHLYLFSQNR